MFQRFPIPRDYFAVDIETTGYSPNYDLVWEIGICDVVDGVAVGGHVIVINWEPIVGFRWLEKKFAKIRPHVPASLQDPPRWSVSYLREYGLPPEDAIRIAADLLKEVGPSKPIVGHQLRKFDLPRLMTRPPFNGLSPPLPETVLQYGIDTGSLEKGAQVRPAFQRNEPASEFFDRISRIFGKVKWSLFDHCVPKYQLREKYQLSEGTEEHAADFDAYVSHLLLEEMRKLAEQQHGNHP